MNLNNTVYYSVREAADILRISEDGLWQKCRTRKVPHHRRGRRYLFTAADIEAIDQAMAPVPVEVSR